MKTLCKLKQGELDKILEDLKESRPAHGYFCRKCHRYAAEKKRLCEAIASKKIQSQRDED